MLCLLAGFVMFQSGSFPARELSPFLQTIAEATLALVLFADAAHLKVSRLKGEANWPVRMLGFGFPFAVLIGTAVNFLLFPVLDIWEIILLAALLTPTDAALGASIFSNRKVPAKVRDSLVVESGLNDGLALPFIIFAACAAIGEQHRFASDGWLVFAMKQIGFGLVVGAALGALGGWLVFRSVNAGMARENYASMFAVLLITIVFLLAHELGGNSFVAVFIAGLLFGRFSGKTASRIREFVETDGTLLTMISFLFIGAILLPRGLGDIGVAGVITVALSLFFVRPLAIWLSFAGTETDTSTRLFFGWFGPRGLATALFAIFVIAEFEQLQNKELIIAITACAVAASAVLHGVSAYWAGKFFER